MRKRLDLTGQRFGRLVVLRYARRSEKGRDYWECRCDCGELITVAQSNLKSKFWKGKSCGCYRKEITRKRSIRNGYGIHLPKGESGFREVFHRYKYAAQKRGLKFQLPQKIFRQLLNGQCFYCGIGPATEQGEKDSHSFFVYNGIDRVNSSGDYVPENVVTCCKRCNEMKMAHSQKEFLAHVERIYKHQHNLKKGKND